MIACACGGIIEGSVYLIILGISSLIIFVSNFVKKAFLKK
jgi:hypothetical protein